MGRMEHNVNRLSIPVSILYWQAQKIDFPFWVVRAAAVESVQDYFHQFGHETMHGSSGNNHFFH